MVTKAFRWWHAAAILLVANAIGAIPVGFGGDAAFYNALRQPALAPPDWLFPPMWLFLNVTSLIALHLVWNSPHTPQRKAVIALELVGWVLFAAFPWLYFGLQSTTLGAVDTVVSLAVAAPSAWMASKISGVGGVLIGFRVAWLALASYVSTYAAVMNSDPFFRAW